MPGDDALKVSDQQTKEHIMIARDIMTPQPIFAESTTPIQEVIALLHEIDVRHLPIVHRGELVGIISDRDLKVLTEVVFFEDEGSEALADHLAEPISTLMQSGVVYVDAEDELSEVVELMIDHRVGAIPVVQSNRGGLELVGIISYIDLLKEASF